MRNEATALNLIGIVGNILLYVLFKTEQKATSLIKYKLKTFLYYL
jgi:hypothetical protein